MPPAVPLSAPTLSIVMPALDEEAGIDRAIDAAIEVFDALVACGTIACGEVVVVDDGSRDATAERVACRGVADPRVRLVRHERNRGLGGAVRSGLAAATGDLVLYTDADLPFDLTELHEALRLMRVDHADVVSAYRRHRTGEGALRLVYSYLYNLLVRSALGLHVRDVNFAGKLLSRAVVDDLELRSEGSFIDAELMARAERRGYAIVQFGVDYFPRTRGVSTLSSPRVIAEILHELRLLRPAIRATRPPR